MTDQGSSLGSSFIVSNITNSGEFLSITFLRQTFSLQGIEEMYLRLMEYRCEFHSFSRKKEQNISCELRHTAKLIFSKLLIFVMHSSQVMLEMSYFVRESI